MLIIAALKAVRLIGPTRATWAPAIEITAVAIGVVAASLILVASATGPLFGFGDIFRPDGRPWDLELHGFLVHHALLLLASPFALICAVAAGHAGTDVTGMTILLGVAA